MTVTLNGVYGVTITPELINNTGQIAAAQIVDSAETAALWQWGGAPVSFQTPSSTISTIITIGALNGFGEIAGTVTGSSISTATLWENGSSITLPNWSGDNLGSATGINDFGIAVGVSWFWSDNAGPIRRASVGLDDALVWTDKAASLLSPLLDDSSAVANAINDYGQIVGQSISSPPPVDATNPSRAVTWVDGTVTALATVTGAQSSAALLINTGGDIAGEATFADGSSHAVLWRNGVATDLSSLSGYNWSEPAALNDLGQIVGTASTTNSFNPSDGGTQHAVLWQNGKIIDLNSLLPANSGIVLQSALSINDAGEVLCYGTSGMVTDLSFLLDLNGSPMAVVSTAASVVQAIQQGVATHPVTFADTAGDVSANLDGLQAVVSTGKLGTVLLIDSITPTLTLTDAQLTADAGAWTHISGNFILQTPSAVIDGFSGTASQYSVSGSNGTVIVSGNGTTQHLSNVFALQFADQSDIVAATPGTSAVTTGNVTELYAAVLGREPDVAGLAFYQSYLTTNPSTPLLQFAEWFLSSPEYAAAHSYAQTTAGDAQFITDSYQNLLHRTPTAAEIDFYQTNVMAKALTGLTAGSSAYSAAEFQAHAQMLVYFSASPEFLSDVQITAVHPADAQHWLVLT